MKTRSTAARIVPALMVAAATAVPAATAVDLLAHASAATPHMVALSTSLSGSPSLAGSAGSGMTATPSVVSGSGSATSAAGAPTTTTASTSQTYTGTSEENRYGTVQATIEVTGNKITSVMITAPQDNPRSAYINSYAVPILVSETLQAQSANIDTVSGATYTSDSYTASLQAALDAAHL